MKFSELDLHPDLLTAIGYMGFEEATPIQSQAIPKIKDGKDLIACAQTGTGKTGAFVIPMLNHLMHNPGEGIKALIICPTRELAIQIDQQIEGIAYGTGISSIPIYGGGDGDDWVRQKKAMVDGINIIVATPGKLISHLNMGYVKFDQLSHLILDEADRMLDIGFHDDILKIISYLPSKRQNLMFSATMPPKIRDFAKKFLNNPDEISIAISKPAEGVLQAAYLAYDNQKIKLIEKLIKDKPEYKKIIIFSSTKKGVSEIRRSLSRAGMKAASISSDLEQTEREEVILKFKQNKIRVLIGTDVISRGIDVKDVNLVINFNVPSDAEDYVHRIGRTARADTTGVAITLIDEYDMYDFLKIERLIEKEVIKIPLPPEIGTGPVWNENPAPKKKFGGKKNFKGGKGKKGGKKPFNRNKGR